jgi:thiamine biosynthesis lipoprotein
MIKFSENLRCKFAIMRIFLFFLFFPFFNHPNQPQRSELKAFRLQGYAQGTTYHITYYAASQLIYPSATDSLLNAIDSSLSLYKPYSLISRFNNSERGVRMDQHLKTVVKKSLKIYKTTSGIFDITVQPLVEAWGFGVKPSDVPPDPEQIRRLLPCVGSGKLLIKGDSLIKTTPCVRIDLNGIAQGYTADVLAAFLEKKGIRHYLTEIGGEIRLKGRKQPGNKKMILGIESPSSDALAGAVIQRKIVPSKGAVTTSGNYRKYYESGKKRISHLIDPRTGFPFSNELISVTVWAKDGITADGYDNPLMGMGLNKALQFVNTHRELEAYFIYHRPDGSIADTATKGFSKIMLK